MTEQEVWTIWVEEQIHREGVEKFKGWYDAQMKRTEGRLHPVLITQAEIALERSEIPLVMR